MCDDRTDRENNEYSSFFLPEHATNEHAVKLSASRLKREVFFLYISLLQDIAGIVLGIPGLKKRLQTNPWGLGWWWL